MHIENMRLLLTLPVSAVHVFFALAQGGAEGACLDGSTRDDATQDFGEDARYNILVISDVHPDPVRIQVNELTKLISKLLLEVKNNF